MRRLMQVMMLGLAGVFGVGVSAVRAQATGTNNVIRSGTTAWADSARVGRADMLILGDSVTWFDGHGWDQGMTAAAAHRFGLAGTGLIGDAYWTGQGYGFSTFGGHGWGNGFASTLDAVPADRRGYALGAGGPPITAGATPVGGFAFGVSADGPLNPNGAYDWTLYTASQPGGGTIGAYRRLGVVQDGYFFNTVGSVPTVATATPANGLQKTVLHFGATPAYPSTYAQEFRLQETTNTSVFYSRLSKPGATGVTVSSLGLGGQGTKAFYNTVLASMSGDGRRGYLSALVDGGSGKLNVMIAEGLNDRNDRTLSLNGVGTGNSPEGFRDNLTSLIALLRTDWAAAGYAAKDLSFTLVGMYSDSADVPTALLNLTAVERQLALADPQISYVDLYANSPSHTEAMALGYLSDGIHPTLAGAKAYSSIVMNAIDGLPGTIIPEPTALGAIGMLMLTGLRRVRRGG